MQKRPAITDRRRSEPRAPTKPLFSQSGPCSREHLCEGAVGDHPSAFLQPAMELTQYSRRIIVPLNLLPIGGNIRMGGYRVSFPGRRQYVLDQEEARDERAIRHRQTSATREAAHAN